MILDFIQPPLMENTFSTVKYKTTQWIFQKVLLRVCTITTSAIGTFQPLIEYTQYYATVRRQKLAPLSDYILKVLEAGIEKFVSKHIYVSICIYGCDPKRSARTQIVKSRNRQK